MKLESFLLESSFESIERMDQVFQAIPDSKGRILHVLESVKKKYKFIESDFDAPINLLRLKFSNGLLNMMVGFRFSKNEADDGQVKAVVVRASVVGSLLSQDEQFIAKNSTDELIKVQIWDFNGEHDLSEFEKETKAVLDAADKFSDWYFDLSAEYGKVKLFKTKNDVFGTGHQGDQANFLALAGNFSYQEDLISPAPSASNISTKIY